MINNTCNEFVNNSYSDLSLRTNRAFVATE